MSRFDGLTQWSLNLSLSLKSYCIFQTSTQHHEIFLRFLNLKICREIAQSEFECDFRKVLAPLWTNMNMSCTLLIQLGRHDLKWFFVKALYEYGRCVVLVPVFSSPKLLFSLLEYIAKFS